MNDFYSHKRVEELIREQGVVAGALDDWLRGSWSDEEDEEVNAFLAMRREYNVPHRSKIEESEETESLVPTS